jgi:Uma2 family endonuclease
MNMAKPTTGEKLTYADFLRFPDDGRRHELIDGAHCVTPSPTTAHQRLVMRLSAALAACLDASGAGEVFAAPFDVVLSEHDVLEPDLLVVLNDQVDILTERHVRGAPALVIEVLSPGTRRRDEGIKCRLYDRVGVREYWMADPAGQSVKVHRRGPGGALVQASLLTADGTIPLTSPLLPELSIDLRRLFSAPRRSVPGLPFQRK